MTWDFAEILPKEIQRLPLGKTKDLLPPLLNKCDNVLKVWQ